MISREAYAERYHGANIYDGGFDENDLQLSVVNGFSKSSMIGFWICLCLGQLKPWIMSFFMTFVPYSSY